MIRYSVILLHWQAQIKKVLGIMTLLLAIFVTIDTTFWTPVFVYDMVTGNQVAKGDVKIYFLQL